MENIFIRGPSLNSRLVLALVLSATLIVLDYRFKTFSGVRIYLNSMVAPLQYMANMPSDAMNWAARAFASKQRLLEENDALTHQAIRMSEERMRYQYIKAENDRLLKLLGSSEREVMRKMVAELMAIDNNPYSHQIVIDKGAIDGVFQGQPVLDEHGIVGQVLQVASTNSRILLISDITHGTPARIKRNDVRVIATGSGALTELVIEHVAHSTDIQEGDLLLSSGLGNIFPEGYPVAKVTSVVRDESRPFAEIKAEPTARLDRLKYLLLLWPNESDAPKSTEASAQSDIENTPSQTQPTANDAGH